MWLHFPFALSGMNLCLINLWFLFLLTFWYWISFVLYFIAFWCGWELVTFSPCPLAKAPDVSNAGRHLSAAEFHSVLQNAGELWFPFWFALPFGLLSFYWLCLFLFFIFCSLNLVVVFCYRGNGWMVMVWVGRFCICFSGKLGDKESVADDKGLVLLDARNLY